MSCFCSERPPNNERRRDALAIVQVLATTLIVITIAATLIRFAGGHRLAPTAAQFDWFGVN